MKAWFLSWDRKKSEVLDRRGGGRRALCVYGERSQQHRLTGNGVFFACWVVPLVLAWQGGDECAGHTDYSHSIIIYLPLYQAVCFSSARVYLSAEQQLEAVTGCFIDRRPPIDFLWFTVSVRELLRFKLNCFLSYLQSSRCLSSPTVEGWVLVKQSHDHSGNK